jgi:hypothetical protein
MGVLQACSSCPWLFAHVYAPPLRCGLCLTASLHFEFQIPRASRLRSPTRCVLLSLAVSHCKAEAAHAHTTPCRASGSSPVERKNALSCSTSHILVYCSSATSSCANTIPNHCYMVLLSIAGTVHGYCNNQSHSSIHDPTYANRRNLLYCSSSRYLPIL